MNRRRVVVTGMGVLAPNGNNRKEYWNALIQGKSGIDRITYFDTDGFAGQIAGELKNFNPENFIDRRELRKLDPFTVYGLVAAQEAVEQANIDFDQLDRDRIGVNLGTGVGGIRTLEDQAKSILDRGPRRVSPHFVPKMIANIAAAQIAIRWGLEGPNQTIITACASSTDAIGNAVRMIRAGDVDMMLSGGSEASVTPLTIAGFGNMKALCTSHNDDPQTASRPFDHDRDGFVLSEGSGFLVLETEEHARQRGAPILAEISGYGATDDAFHVTQPVENGAGAVKAMQKAIADAGIDPTEIDYINAHGTSTPFNDKNETAAIKSALGDHAAKVQVSSTKSMTGHLLGASGAIEAIASILAIQNQQLPPTINYQNPDPDCDLHYVPNQAMTASVKTVMSNSLGFGGHNSVLIFRQWDQA